MQSLWIVYSQPNWWNGNWKMHSRQIRKLELNVKLYQFLFNQSSKQEFQICSLCQLSRNFSSWWPKCKFCVLLLLRSVPTGPNKLDLWIKFYSPCVNKNLWSQIISSSVCFEVYISAFYVFVFSPQVRGEPELLRSFRERRGSEVQLQYQLLFATTWNTTDR